MGRGHGLEAHTILRLVSGTVQFIKAWRTFTNWPPVPRAAPPPPKDSLLSQRLSPTSRHKREDSLSEAMASICRRKRCSVATLSADAASVRCPFFSVMNALLRKPIPKRRLGRQPPPTIHFISPFQGYKRLPPTPQRTLRHIHCSAVTMRAPRHPDTPATNTCVMPIRRWHFIQLYKANITHYNANYRRYIRIPNTYTGKARTDLPKVEFYILQDI